MESFLLSRLAREAQELYWKARDVEGVAAKRLYQGLYENAYNLYRRQKAFEEGQNQLLHGKPAS